MNLLRDDHIDATYHFLLLDPSGAVAARVAFMPNGQVTAFPNDLLPSGYWTRKGQVLSLTNSENEPVASFNAEGLDERGRKLIWGNIMAGSLRLEYSLREVTDQDHFPRISLCICCKGRLNHLKETLLQNIRDNMAYPNLEFVLLNYNSGDGLEEWINDTCQTYIDSGLLSYYSTSQPKYFHPTHSRNMAIRLAAGDIVCVVDADNYTGPGFAFYLADNIKRNNFLVACRMENGRFEPVNDEGCAGRFALYKDVFLDVGGMDEAHVGWGYDDLDLYYRLMAKGYQCQTIPHRYARCIPHSDSERSKELEQGEIGRETATTHGTCFINSERSKANIDAGLVVVNDGYIGCGGVIKNLGKSAMVVHRHRQPTISVCMVLGNQMGQLQHTLCHNLQLTRLYPNMEFVLLSHGHHEIERLVYTLFRKEVDAGRVVHYQMTEPYLDFGTGNPVHQANLCMRLAKGDILYYTFPDQLFSEDFTQELATHYHDNWIYQESEGGGLVISRHLFYLAKGLDETLLHGPAIKDFLHRLQTHFSERHSLERSMRAVTEDFGGGSVLRNRDTIVVSPHRFPKVSLITICMGRLEHLKRTLPQNIADNADYPNIEFLLLDYSDQHGLRDWVSTEMAGHIASGRLIYYHHPGQESFMISHAKNMAMRLATGEFLCNVDADNFTGHHFAFYLAEQLQHTDFLMGCLTVKGEIDSYCDQGMAGRVALPRWLFYRTGGFDEKVTGWGYDDIDFYQRLRALGYTGQTMDSRFLQCIAHGDEERAAHTGVEDIGGVMRANEGTARINRERSERNVLAGNLVLNAGIFGTGEVYRNFSMEPIEIAPFTYHRISFYTTSMGRLHHLCQTLPQNIEDNRSYPNLEFILLDYNSQDGLEKWAEEHLAAPIKTGRLVYYKYTGRKYFDRCHARNLAARVASGDILCNIDADNFTGANFAHYINERFSHSPNIFLRPDFDGAHSRLRDAFGRLCVRKKHFHAVEGYDEKFIDYGYEDNDICNRLERIGIEPALIEDNRFLRYITHNNMARMENGMLVNSLMLMLIGRHPNQEWDTFVCLFWDGEFFCFGPRMNILPDKGQWERNSAGLLLWGSPEHACQLFDHLGGRFSLKMGDTAFLVLKESKDMSSFFQAYFNHSLIQNGERFRGNQQSNSCSSNEGNYGLATVFRNFEETPIQLQNMASLAGII